MSEQKSTANENQSAGEEAPQRRQVFIQMTLFGVDATLSGATEKPVQHRNLSGTGTVSSECGTSTYVISGTVAYRTRAEKIGLHNITLMGQRLSGYDSGDISLKIDSTQKTQLSEGGDFAADVVLTYSDDNNTNLSIQTRASGAIIGQELQSLRLDGQGEGFSFAEFLADSETLDEESGD